MPNTNRTTTGVVLPPEVYNEIWQPTINQSAIMQLAKPMSVPGAGLEFQQITSDPIASWVKETELAGVSSSDFKNKTTRTHKLTVIEAFSKELVRDDRALYEAAIGRVPSAFAKKFDNTVLGATAPGDGFDTLGNCSKVSILPGETGAVYKSLITANASIAAAGGIMNGVGLAPQGQAILLGELDANGRPVFNADVHDGQVGNILGARTNVSKGLYVSGDTETPAVVGVTGDFDDAYYGMTGAIEMQVDTSATLKDGDDLVFLFQQDMVAVKFTWYLTFIVKNTAEFVLLTGAKAAA